MDGVVPKEMGMSKFADPLKKGIEGSTKDNLDGMIKDREDSRIYNEVNEELMVDDAQREIDYEAKAAKEATARAKEGAEVKKKISSYIG